MESHDPTASPSPCASGKDKCAPLRSRAVLMTQTCHSCVKWPIMGFASAVLSQLRQALTSTGKRKAGEGSLAGGGAVADCNPRQCLNFSDHAGAYDDQHDVQCPAAKTRRRDPPAGVLSPAQTTGVGTLDLHAPLLRERSAHYSSQRAHPLSVTRIRGSSTSQDRSRGLVHSTATSAPGSSVPVSKVCARHRLDEQW